MQRESTADSSSRSYKSGCIGPKPRGLLVIAIPPQDQIQNNTTRTPDLSYSITRVIYGYVYYNGDIA